MTIAGHRRISSTMVIPLHATKGWRHQEYRPMKEADNWLGYFHRGSNTPRWSRPDFQFPNEAARKASLMRHGWYRRKMRREYPDQECYW